MLERQKKLLQLLAEQDTHKPASFFSSKLKVSTKTIYSDLQELDGYLRKQDLTIDRIPRVGIRLIDPKRQMVQKLQLILDDEPKQDLNLEARRLVLLKEVILNERAPNLEDLSERFMVSKTSLYKGLVWLRNLTGEDVLDITSGSEGIRCEGAERNIQKAVFMGAMAIGSQKASEIGKSLDAVEQTLFETDILQAVSQVLLVDYADLSEGVSEYYLNSLRTVLLIFLTRLKASHHMEQDEDFLFNTIRYMETFVVANSMAQLFREALDVTFTTDDLEYLSRQLFAHRITSRLRRRDLSCEDLALRLIQRLEEVEKVSLRNDEQLLQELRYHLPPMLLRLRKNILVENPLLDEIKTQYSELFHVIWYVLSIVESEYDVRLNDHEVSFVLIYFQLALDRVSRARNILVICPYGLSSSQLILSKIRRFLPSRDNIEAASLKKMRQGSLDNVDLVITSVDPGQIPVPCVRVSPLITDEDLIKVMNTYTSHLIERKKVPESLTNINTPVLARLISPQHITLQADFRTREECLVYLCSQLEQEGLVRKGYRESVFAREKMGATGLSTQAAVPHADPELVCTSAVSILSLKKPVRWGDVQVSLVVMASISEQDADLFHNLIMEIYSLIQDRKTVDDLLSITDSNELSELLTMKGKSNVL